MAELAPISRIVGVGWRAGDIAVSFGAMLTVGARIEYSVGGGTAPTDPYTDTFAHTIDPVQNGATQVWAGSGGSWAEQDLSTVSLASLPDIAATRSYSDWAWNGPNGINTKAPFARWLASSDSVSTGIATPAGGIFSQGLSPQLGIVGQQIVDGPFENVGASVKWAHVATDGWPGPPAVSQMDAVSFPLAGTTLTFAGKTYAPLATYVVTGVGSYWSGLLLALFRKT